MLNVPILVRDALKSGSYRNNYIFEIFNQDNQKVFEIDNRNLISESVVFDERLCSGDVLKFGLCEGNSIEFQYFNYPSIRGMRVKATISVEYRNDSNELDYYDIPMGWFTCDKCSVQASTGIIKASCFNDLRADWLDADVKPAILPAYKYAIQTQYPDVQFGMVLDFALQSIGVYRDIPLWPGMYGPVGEDLVTMTTYRDHHYYIEVDGERKYLSQLKVKYRAQSTVNAEGSMYAQMSTNPYVVFNKLIELTGLSADTPVKIYAGGETTIGAIIGESYGTMYSSEVASNVWRIKFGDYRDYNGIVRSPNQIPHTNVNIVTCEYELSIYSAGVEWTDETAAAAFEQIKQLILEKNVLIGLVSLWSSVGNMDIPYSAIEKNEKITLRELLSAHAELDTQFVRLDRNSNELTYKEMRLSSHTPLDTYYPADYQFPGGSGSLVDDASETTFKNLYSRLWADYTDIHNFKNVVATYLNEDTGKEETVTVSVNLNGTDDYVMNDNWMLKNVPMDSLTIKNLYLSRIVGDIRNYKWLPFEMDCSGMPYVEAGDPIDVVVGDTTHRSYILSRNLKGIQDLRDTYVNGNVNIF